MSRARVTKNEELEQQLYDKILDRISQQYNMVKKEEQQQIQQTIQEQIAPQKEIILQQSQDLGYVYNMLSDIQRKTNKLWETKKTKKNGYPQPVYQKLEPVQQQQQQQQQQQPDLKQWFQQKKQSLAPPVQAPVSANIPQQIQPQLASAPAPTKLDLKTYLLKKQGK